MAYRIVAKSPKHLNDIVEDIMSWFETARDYRTEFDTESRKFADPATKQIVTKKIDVVHVQDPMTGKKTVIKFIPLLRPEEMKIEMGGENEHVMKGKIKNMMKGRGEFKTYNKDTLRKMENQMKISEFKKMIREEVRKAIKEGYEITLAGDTIKGSGDKWPEVVVTMDNDKVTLAQKIGGRTSKVMLSKKQFAQLIKEA